MDFDRSLLLNLYRTMVRIRLFEESLVEPILAGEIRTPCHLYSGQEAIAAGVCAALGEDDYIFGNHRSHGHFLAKGGDMKEMCAEIFTRETGCSRGRGGSMHLIDTAKGMLGSAPIVGGTISLAVGAALAISIRGSDQVAVSFFGDGAAGEGTLYESLNLAGLKRLPILFICENNFYSTHMPICECRVKANICGVAKPFGVGSAQVDGNEVLDVYRSARDAVALSRRGRGPFFLECLTYRMRGHVGPDDNIQGFHTDIRPAEEVERWRAKDPILRFKRYLVSNNLVEEQELKTIAKAAAEEVSEAHAFAAASPFPEQEYLMRYVYK